MFISQNEPIGKAKNNNKMLQRKIAIIALILYSSLLIYWMFFSFGRTVHSEYSYNLIPLKTILSFFNKNIEPYEFIINIFGNIGVFIPVGILFPIAFNLSQKKSNILFIALITALEILQLLTKRGTCDVDDIILNTLGFNIGYFIMNLINKNRKMRFF